LFAHTQFVSRPKNVKCLINTSSFYEKTNRLLVLRSRSSEKGGDGVEPKTVEAVNTALKAPHTFTKVEHTQHFSFLTVCPPKLAEQEPVLCKDPPGLDRAEFHEQFNDALTKFFRAYL
jgi:hypothetical protein